DAGPARQHATETNGVEIRSSPAVATGEGRHTRCMRRLAGLLLVAAALFAGPAAASPIVRLTIMHYVHGCHVWQLGGHALGSATTLKVRPGTRVAFRSDCPMDFDFAQTSGPRLALGPARMYAGTSRTIVFAKRGVYRLTVKNVQSSEERGLVTLGADNGLT